MKNKILVFFAIMLLIPMTVFAKDYNEFDIRFEEKIGSNVKNNEIKVFCKVDDNDKFVDHTEDFTMEDVRWYKYTSVKEDGKTEEDYDYYDEEKNVYGYLVSDDDVFEEGYEYFLYIARLYAKEEDSFSRNVTINGVDIDEMDGQCFNTGNEFFIKTKARGTTGSNDVEEPATIDNVEEGEKDIATPEGKACMLGISLCCTMFLGISICTWILIAIILLILIIAICTLKAKKRKEV